MRPQGHKPRLGGGPAGPPPWAPGRPGAMAEAWPGLSLRPQLSPRAAPAPPAPTAPRAAPWGGLVAGLVGKPGCVGAFCLDRASPRLPRLPGISPKLSRSPKLSISRGSPGSDVGGRRCRCHPGWQLRLAQPALSAGVSALGRWVPPCSLHTDNKRRVVAN